jgi:hypothetical protein
MTYTEENRGKIQFRDRARQIIDFSGMRFGNITPTDIDGFFERRDEIFIFYEFKYGEASMPEGQKKALKRTIDAITASGRKAALFVCSHDVSDATQDIDAAKAKVRWYYYDHRQIWEHKDRNVKEATDAYLAKMEELLCDAKRNKELPEGLSDPGADSTNTRM